MSALNGLFYPHGIHGPCAQCVLKTASDTPHALVRHDTGAARTRGYQLPTVSVPAEIVLHASKVVDIAVLVVV
jgi:hypothetical protein